MEISVSVNSCNESLAVDDICRTDQTAAATGRSLESCCGCCIKTIDGILVRDIACDMLRDDIFTGQIERQARKCTPVWIRISGIQVNRSITVGCKLISRAGVPEIRQV